MKDFVSHSQLFRKFSAKVYRTPTQQRKNIKYAINININKQKCMYRREMHLDMLQSKSVVVPKICNNNISADGICFIHWQTSTDVLNEENAKQKLVLCRKVLCV